jgi:hypothetical protein
MFKTIIGLFKLLPFVIGVVRDIYGQFKQAEADRKAEKHEKLAIALDKAKGAKNSEERKAAIDSLYDSLN